jgi:hypothetical protein
MVPHFPNSGFCAKKVREKCNDEALECSLLHLLETSQYDAVKHLHRLDILLAMARLQFRDETWLSILETITIACGLGWHIPDLLILKGR